MNTGQRRAVTLDLIVEKLNTLVDRQDVLAERVTDLEACTDDYYERLESKIDEYRSDINQGVALEVGELVSSSEENFRGLMFGLARVQQLLSILLQGLENVWNILSISR